MSKSNRLLSLHNSNRRLDDSTVTKGLTRLDSRRINLNRSQLIYDNIGQNNIYSSCAFHTNEKITNFCTNKNCLLPLCPKCVKLHIDEHNKMGIFGEFNTIEESLKQAETNLKASINKLSYLQTQFFRVKESYQSNTALQKTSLREARIRCIEYIQRYFDYYEQALNSFKMAQNGEFVDDLRTSEFFLKQTAQVLTTSLDKIENAQTMMEGIINYYSKAEDILKIQATQQNLNKLFPQTLAIEYRLFQLEKLPSILKNYLYVNVNNKEVWGRFSRLFFNDQSNKKISKFNDTKTSKADSPEQDSKLSRQFRKTGSKEKRTIQEKGSEWRCNSILDTFTSPLENFSLEKLRRQKKQIK